MDSTNGVQGLIALQFHLTKAQVDAAGGNVPQHQDYTITIDDHHGGVRSETISIPLAEILNNAGNGGGGGNNTDPLIFINPTAHDAATGTVFDDFGHPDRQHLIERLSFSDAEPAQTHSVGDAVGIDPGPLGILGTMFLSVLRNTDGTTTGPVPDPDGFLAASATGGVLKWDYQVDESKIQWFGEGETYTDKFQFMLTDDHGGMTTQEVAVTIQGQNDLPILGGDAQGVLSLDFDLSPVPPSSNIEQTHSFTFIDPDRTDTHTIWAELDSSTVGASVGVLTADLIEDTYTSGVHDENGQIRWTYHLNQAPAAQGQQIWDILIDDGHGITKVPFTVDFHL
jgi:VCBS repeat-containing protein